MRLLVLGANGQVGFELLTALAPLGEVIGATRSGRLPGGSACERADLGAPASLADLVDRIGPDVVINAAAYTAVDRAEDEPEAAWAANAEAPTRLASTCARVGARLIHYSTDYVFDGHSRRPWRESDPVAPLGEYGRSKRAGEEGVMASGGRHWIFRTSWVYGARGNNFLRTMLRLGAERDHLRVVADQTGSPTPSRLVAAATAAALARGGPERGLWHMTCSGSTTWHGFAEALFRGAVAAGLLPRAPLIEPIASTDWPTRAHRPMYSCMDISRLHADFDLRLQSWERGLDQVIGELADASLSRAASPEQG